MLKSLNRILTTRLNARPMQNTRARERKGQFRAHQQVINKRCPFCPALFKVRSALESHLASKHADQFAKGEINIDALPDAEGGVLLGDPGESSRSPAPVQAVCPAIRAASCPLAAALLGRPANS